MADESLAALAVRFGADTSAAEQALRQFSHFFQGIMKEMTEGARGRYKKNVVVDEAAAQVERIKQVQTEMLGAQAELEAKFLQQPFSRSDFMKMETMRNSGYSRDADAYEKSLYRKQDAESAHAKAMSAVQAGQLDAARAFYKVYLDLTESEEQKRERLILEAAARVRKQIVAENEATLAAANKTLLETQITDFAKRLMDMTRGYKGVLEGMPMTSRFSPMLEEGGRLGVKGPEMDALQELHSMDLQLQTIRAAERRANLNGEYDLAVELHKMAGDMEASINRSVHDKNMDNIDAEARANIQAARDGAEATKAQDAATAAARVRTAQEAERKMTMDRRLVLAERLRETLRDPTDPSKGTFAREAARLENMVRFEQQISQQFGDPVKALEKEQKKAAAVMGRAFATGNKEMFDTAARAYDGFGDRIKQVTEQKIVSGAANARYAVMNLAYGVQDAATVYETSGFAGAIRASANNMTALGSLMGEAAGKAGDLRAAFAAPEVALIAFSTALMIGADAYAKYQKAEKEFLEQRKKILDDFNRARQDSVDAAGERVDIEQKLRDLETGSPEQARAAVQAQGDLVEQKEAELARAKELLAFEEKRKNQLEAQAKAAEKRLADSTSGNPLEATLPKGMSDWLKSTRMRFEEATADKLGIPYINLADQAATARERADAANKAYNDAKSRVRETTGELQKQDTLFGRMVGVLQKTIGLESERGKQARDVAEFEREQQEAAKNQKDRDREAERDKKRQDREKDKEDRRRTKEEEAYERRISDIAIAQAEKIYANRQAQLKSVYDVPMAGMAQAGSQEAANIRARSMRREADAEKKELQEQLKVSREQLDELKAIREQMQPGYLVESFKP